MHALKELERIQRYEVTRSFVETHLEIDDDDLIECIMETALESSNIDSFATQVKDVLDMDVDSAFKQYHTIIRETVDGVNTRGIIDGEKYLKNPEPLISVKSEKDFLSGSGSGSGSESEEVDAVIHTLASGGKKGIISGVPIDDSDFILNTSKAAQARGRVLTDFEKWELSKLRSTNVRDESYDANEKGVEFSADAQRNIDIEVRNLKPVFMRGIDVFHSKKNAASNTLKQQQQPSVTHSNEAPRVVSVPEGSLWRSAERQQEIAREKKILKDQADQHLIDSIPKDLNRPWQDPAPNPGERLLANTLHGITRMVASNKNRLEGTHQKNLLANAVMPALSFGPRSKLSIREQRETLPIFKMRSHFLTMMTENQILIVQGETGSGKTTQMPQYLYEAGFAQNGMIACTQPRRVAAKSIAGRVADEIGCRLGETVGYAFRYEDMTSPGTRIKYMTDGLLLREALTDPILSRYTVIILDEAHERTLSTDVLFGLLKQAVRRRADLKIIVTSATLEFEKFSTYFFSAKQLHIPGRTYPVEILHVKEPEVDYLEAALSAVLRIHFEQPPGDILVFLTGKDEIDSACEELNSRMERLAANNPPPLLVYPAYSSLPSELQSAIFEPAPPGCRKCILATNIAEASLTIDGVYFVIDPGFAKVKMHDPKRGLETLKVVPISQANAKQRTGRAGRTGPGRCYRLYTEHAYLQEMAPSAKPELLRSNLANVVLLLKAMGVVDVFKFEFMDAPAQESLAAAMLSLYELGALDDEGFLTPNLGRRMVEFPIDPPLSKALLASVDLKCSGEVLKIVSMLQVPNVFHRPRDKQAMADAAKAKFHQAEGDHLTLLEVYRNWESTGYNKEWCFKNFVQHRALCEAREILKQLRQTMDRLNLSIVDAAGSYSGVGSIPENVSVTIRKSLSTGYFKNACKRDPAGDGYRKLVGNDQVYIHPSSALYQQQPEFVLYHELVHTAKEYIRDVSTISGEWLPLMAPHVFKQVAENALTAQKRREKIKPLFKHNQADDAWKLKHRSW